MRGFPSNRIAFLEKFVERIHLAGIGVLVVPFLVLNVGVILDTFALAIVLFLLFLPVVVLVSFFTVYEMVQMVFRENPRYVQFRVKLGSITCLTAILMYIWILCPRLE